MLKFGGMTLISVSSSAIQAVGFDGYTLRVVFHHGGTYDHPGVPRSEFEALLHASSIVAYYVRHIRGRYQ